MIVLTMESRLGRNDKCHCGSGKKYKKCCLVEDERKESLKRGVMKISRRDFISGPYRNCPNQKCGSTGTFGVFLTIEGAHSYTRECYECGYQESFSLPSIKKKIVYLDQFVISNLIKLLDKSHPSHHIIKSDPFWETLFIKLERASRSQAIVCPDSFYHRDESLTGGIDFRLMKRLYEHFSSGKTLHPSDVIERTQIAHHFDGWIDGQKVEFKFDPQEIAFDRDLHTWSVGLRISVGGNPYPGQLANLQKVNATTKEELKQIWVRWQRETNVSFISRVKEETLGLGKGLIDVAQRFARRRAAVMAKLASGEPYDMDLDDVMPPMANEIIESIVRIAREKSIAINDVPSILVRYFTDVEALLEIPQVRISSVMFAGMAHRAAHAGRKRPPKSTTDIQFISSYLPYCDAVFVDKESAELLTQFPRNTPDRLRLREFSAKVFSLSNKGDFLSYLDRIVAEIPDEQIALLKDMSGENYADPYWTILEHEKRDTQSQNSGRSSS